MSLTNPPVVRCCWNFSCLINCGSLCGSSICACSNGVEDTAPLSDLYAAPACGSFRKKLMNAAAAGTLSQLAPMVRPLVPMASPEPDGPFGSLISCIVPGFPDLVNPPC